MIRMLPSAYLCGKRGVIAAANEGTSEIADLFYSLPDDCRYMVAQTHVSADVYWLIDMYDLKQGGRKRWPPHEMRLGWRMEHKTEEAAIMAGVLLDTGEQ